MRKLIFLPILFLALSHVASAQTSEKIDKAANDPATRERSEKADALLINRKKIVPDDASTEQLRPATKQKKAKCVKKRS